MTEKMEMTYDSLSLDELQGSSQADCLVSLDGDLRLMYDGALVFHEPGFPVVEFARSLLMWLNAPNRMDFAFDSMSYEEAGSISIVQDSGGWRFRSEFVLEPLTQLMGWSEIENSCLDFIAKVESDLVALGLHPAEVMRR